MGRKTQMPDAPCLFLSPQIVHNSILFVHIRFNVFLVYIVEKIKVKIIHTTFLQLLFKDFLHLVHICQIVAWKLVCQIEALSRVLTQNVSHHDL